MFEVRTIPLASIHAPFLIEYDAAKVRRFRKRAIYLEVPILVRRAEGVYWLSDGWHRFEAARLDGVEELPVVVSS